MAPQPIELSPIGTIDRQLQTRMRAILERVVSLHGADFGPRGTVDDPRLRGVAGETIYAPSLSTTSPSQPTEKDDQHGHPVLQSQAAFASNETSERP